MRMPNGFGSVVNLGKRRRRPYAVRVTAGWSEEKRQIYKYIGYFEEKIDALACLVEYNKNPYELDVKKITLEEVFHKWSVRHFDKISLASEKGYKSAFKLCEPIAKMPFSQLRANHLQTIIDNNKEKSTINILKSLLSQLYLYGLKNEIVDKDYSDYIEMPNKRSKSTRVPFTKEVIDSLWDAENDVSELMLVLLYTGMRISELLDIRPSDVDLDGRYMVGGTKTEAGRNRTIPIHHRIAPIIEKRMSNNYLFQSPRGNKHIYTNLHKRITKTFDELGMKHTIHETRHTFISQADRLGLDRVSVKRIVGHSTRDITDHYTHKGIGDLLEAIDRFDY